jgi:hypothetical protein
MDPIGVLFGLGFATATGVAPLLAHEREPPLWAEALASRPPVCIVPGWLFCRSSSWRVLMLRDDENPG